MALSAENLLYRIRLKKQVGWWRFAAILLAIALGLSLIVRSMDSDLVETDYIARISVDSIITTDEYRDKVLRNLRDDSRVKGVLFVINSPGGTVVGGESLYNGLKAISAKKPVVTSMGSVAASGGYMAAVGTSHIFAYNGTITGSIGVLLQAGEITDLAQKIGVNFYTFKSGTLKGAPSPFEKLSPDASKIIQEGVDDAFHLFIDMVTEGRKQLTREQILALADGRVFTGRQALKAHLIDAIGGEEEAIAWLDNVIGAKIPVKDVELIEPKKGLEALLTSTVGKFLPGANALSHHELLALWQPGII